MMEMRLIWWVIAKPKKYKHYYGYRLEGMSKKMAYQRTLNEY